MKILFFGDIVGKAGRMGVKKLLPVWEKEHAPDLIVANVENIAHGIGITRQYLEELLAQGVDVMTGGNHIVEGKEALKLLDDPALPLIRPANVGSSWTGRGFITIQAHDETPVTVVNLIGQSGMRDNYNSPFEAIETILAREDMKQSVILVDWHAEMTSEKKLLGHYLDGRVVAVLGTHTHVPTADEQILPGGTAFISDVGMAGSFNSIIGVQVARAIERIAKGLPAKFEVEESGPAEVNAVLIEIDPTTKKALWIKRLREIVDF
ncbi:MAG: YmdB family metallophosphoesterase [Candidatus Niyogibacteria bacterium]|nr:YmdB family metallophosphoesterase [Candidatus Niyogibacteria bacterium]